MIILKIIGIILLILLSIILISLALVLFVPINYKLKGKYNDSKKLVGVKVTWLFRAIGLRVIYNETLKIRLTLFGKTLFNKRFKNDISVEFGEDGEEDEKNSNDDIEYSEEIEEKFYEDDQLDSIDIKSENKKIEYNNDVYKKKLSIEDKIVKILEKIRDIFIKVKEIVDKFIYEVEDKIALIENLIDTYVTEDNAKILKKLLLILRRLILHILPRKAIMKGDIGFDDPYITGQIIAFSSIITKEKYSIDVDPNFEDKIINLTFDTSGTIYIGYILFQVLKIILDRKVWKLIKTIKNNKIGGNYGYKEN